MAPAIVRRRKPPPLSYRVTGTGGMYVYKDARQDTFALTADLAKGHTFVLRSSMANSTQKVVDQPPKG